MSESVNYLQNSIESAKSEVSKVIIGQHDVIEKCLIVILTNNHALIEGVPGIAKTLLVKTLSHVLGVEFNRIQFTPDLMPADITGTNIFNMKDNVFNLLKGPIFTSFLLADEINRAPAKTQSALLQAMQEKRVTIDGHTHNLSEFFTVFATQNPIEYEGTYPLPEAQKDRFMLKINMDYPTHEDETTLAEQMLTGYSPESKLDDDTIKKLFDISSLVEMRKKLDTITIRTEIVNYIVSIVRATRNEESILVGAGPRGTQALLLACRALAVIRGNDFVTPDDVKELVHDVLGHRILLRPEFEVEGLTIKDALKQIVKKVEVPR